MPRREKPGTSGVTPFLSAAGCLMVHRGSQGWYGLAETTFAWDRSEVLTSLLSGSTGAELQASPGPNQSSSSSDPGTG